MNTEKTETMEIQGSKDFNELIADMLFEMDKEEGGIRKSAKSLIVTSESGGFYEVSVKVKDITAEMLDYEEE